jgi:fluoride ion exporter CrcB/FEX
MLWVFAGGMLGLHLHRFLPRHHLTKETQDVIRLGSGTISVLASLVLGLLIATAKTTSDTADREMRGALAHMGP